MNPTRRNLLASSGALVSVATLGGASLALGEQATAPPKRKTAGSKTDTTRDPFEKFAYQRAQQGPSTDYIDIRDYGMVVVGGNITAAFQAAMDARSTHGKQRIRIPRLTNTGSFTLDADTLTYGSDAWIFELDCHELFLTGTWSLPTGCTLRGLATDNSNIILSQTRPRPSIRATPAGSIRLLHIDGTPNVVVENLFLFDGRECIYAQETSCLTFRNLVLGTNLTSISPLHIDQCFWINMEHMQVESGNSASTYAIKFTTLIDHGPGGGTNVGLVRMKDIRVLRTGILIQPTFGPVGATNFEIVDLISENQIAGTSLVTLDSISGKSVGEIKLQRLEIADARGTAYLIKNIGGFTRGVWLDSPSVDNVLDPTSEPIEDFVVDHTVRLAGGNTVQQLSSVYAGTPYYHSLRRDYPSATDAKLLCSPVGLPWVFGTPLAVEQDPASWTNLGGGTTITTGQLAPDGSTMAAYVEAGSGARVYTGSHTLALGDWFIVGAWMRSTGVGTVAASGIKIELNAGFDYNGATLEDIATNSIEDRIGGDGWRWICAALKMTKVGTNPCAVNFLLSKNATRTWFNPCAILIPAGTTNFDDTWAMRLARSLKGGWSSTAVAGDVSLLDHQTLKVGHTKLTAKTFATLPSNPVAGMQAYITDCDTTIWGANAAGAGSNKVMVWYNGTNWTVIGK